MKYKLNENQYRVYENMLLEDQEGDSQRKAKDLLVSQYEFEDDEAYKFVHEYIKLLILPLNHNRRNGKYVLGCCRLLINEFGTVIDEGDPKVVKFAKKLSKCIVAISKNDDLYKKYDKNLNGLNLNDLYVELEEYFDQEDNTTTNKERNKDYKIVRINNFEESSYYSRYVDWCITEDNYMYNRYTNNGLCPFYFVLRKGYTKLDRDDCMSEKLLGNYGLSMLAVCIDIDGDLKSCTCRWNHAKGGGDSCMNKKEICELLGGNFEELFALDEKDKNKVSTFKKVQEEYKNYFKNITDKNDLYKNPLYAFHDKMMDKYGMNLKESIHQIDGSGNGILFWTYKTFTFCKHYSLTNDNIYDVFTSDHECEYTEGFDDLNISFGINDSATNEWKLFKMDNRTHRYVQTKVYGENIKAIDTVSEYRTDENGNEIYSKYKIIQNGGKLTIYQLEEDSRKYIKIDKFSEINEYIKQGYILYQVYRETPSYLIDDEDLSANMYLNFMFKRADNEVYSVIYNLDEKKIERVCDKFTLIDEECDYIYENDGKIIFHTNTEEIEYKKWNNYEGKILIFENTDKRKKQTGKIYDVYTSTEYSRHFIIDKTYNLNGYKEIVEDVPISDATLLKLDYNEGISKFLLLYSFEDNHESSFYNSIKYLPEVTRETLYNEYTYYHKGFNLNQYNQYRYIKDYLIAICENVDGDYVALFMKDTGRPFEEIALNDLCGNPNSAQDLIDILERV